MPDRSSRALYTVLLVILLAGCATMRSTPQQEYTWAMWENCKQTLILSSGLTVNRVEPADGVEHYVVKAGTGELFYRVSDLASSFERVDGVVVTRNTPPRLSYVWPLTVGKVWDQDFRNERPVERQTTARNSTWTVAAEETVTVPAGTFRTLKITWRNRNTRAFLCALWYAPEVKQWVKIREVLSNGIRERELVSFKLT